MKNSKLLITLLVVFVIPVMLTVSSCKEPSPPVAVITVLDGDDRAVQGAEVTVYLENINAGYVNIDDELQSIVKFTNSGGQVTLEFKYEAIYDVKAKVYDDDEVIKEGDGVLILEDDETYNETIVVRDI